MRCIALHSQAICSKASISYGMSEPGLPLDHDALSALLQDPVMIRIVTVLNRASLSILELLEYDVTRSDINRAMARGVIEFEKAPMLPILEAPGRTEITQRILETGDYYFGLLSKKVKLTEVGLHILDIIEGDETTAPPGVMPEEADQSNPFGQQVPQL